MPIAQSRVIALINAALDSFRAATEAAHRLSVHPSSLFTHYAETQHTINQELQWFSTHAARNAAVAQKMRDLRTRRRADAELPPPKNRRQHIPKSLFETEFLDQPIESPHTRKYRTIPILNKKESNNEDEWQAMQSSLASQSIRGEGECPRCMHAADEFCPVDLHTLVCPLNRIRCWEPEYESLFTSKLPPSLPTPKPDEWSARDHDPGEMPPEGRNS